MGRRLLGPLTHPSCEQRRPSLSASLREFGLSYLRHPRPFAFCTAPGTQYLIHPTPRYYGPTLMSQVFPLPMSPVLNAAVVAPRKVPFDEAIEDDEQIPTAHLANAQLGQPGLAIVPGVGQHGVGIPADDGLEQQLDGQVEMMGEDWLHAGDHHPTIAFERI